MAAAIKMDELLVHWLGSDDVYQNVLEWIDNYRAAEEARLQQQQQHAHDVTNGDAVKFGTLENSVQSEDTKTHAAAPTTDIETSKTASINNKQEDSQSSDASPRGVIPPFYRRPDNSESRNSSDGAISSDDASRHLRRRTPVLQIDTWEPLPANQDSSSEGSRDQLVIQQQSTASSAETDEDDLLLGGSALSPGSITTSPSGGGDHQQGTVDNTDAVNSNNLRCVRDQVEAVFLQSGQDPPLTSPTSIGSDGGGGVSALSTSSEDEDELGPETSTEPQYDGHGASEKERRADETGSPKQQQPATRNLNSKYLTPENFVPITKEVCRFPSFFNLPLYQRILDLWNEDANSKDDQVAPMEVVTFGMFEWYWKREMEPYDPCDRFYRLVKQPTAEYIGRDDFLPLIKALLSEHPGLEFLSSHAEFQEKYAVTVITRIFYCVNKCHSGRITSRQIRRSDLLEAFQQVDEEEDINKVTRYFSYEHFYVLYCRFWELDHDRDYRITREDLLKYGDHSLSHMICDRIFDAAPRPFEQDRVNRDYLSYEDFIYFMLSEEDKANEVSVRYWFTCVDVDGDGKLNNMEMRSFYAVQLHRMQCMGHEVVPFEDMLCQMMDMIKPSNSRFIVVDDFLQAECCQVSGALFDALFNLNKYLLFEQRDPFVERQKREDEFECDWDRFACIDYNRLAMEEEAREEEAMEIDWVTVDDEDDVVEGENFGTSVTTSAGTASGEATGGVGGDSAGAAVGGGAAVAVSAASNSVSEAPF